MIDDQELLKEAEQIQSQLDMDAHQVRVLSYIVVVVCIIALFMLAGCTCKDYNYCPPVWADTNREA